MLSSTSLLLKAFFELSLDIFQSIMLKTKEGNFPKETIRTKESSHNGEFFV